MTNPMPDWHRRRLLKANLATAALFLPLPYAQAWAQSDGAIRLLRLPKLALVIGNSNYKNAPPLGNPGNDAKAIGETLRQSGFEDSPRWRRYYEVITPGWERALGLLKDLLEGTTTTAAR